MFFDSVNPLTGRLKPQSKEPLYSNTVIGTLAVDGWAAPPRPLIAVPNVTVNDQCTNFVLFDMAL